MAEGGGGRSSSPQPVINPPLMMGSFVVPSQPISSMISTTPSGTSIPMTVSNPEQSTSITQSVGSRSTNGQLQRAISPPTPAPSPQPEARNLRQSDIQNDQNDIINPDEDVSPLLKLFSREFPNLDNKERHAFLAHFVDLCNARELAHLSSLISPRLKVDFLSALPIEVSLQIMSYLDDPRTLARASCVSRFWRSLVNDEQTWKVMCRRYRFRQVPVSTSRSNMLGIDTPDQTMQPTNSIENDSISTDSALLTSPEQQMQQSHSSSVESSQVLGGLYDTYRARGLDPSTALSELKALHGLFLSKRAREIGVEERRRQLHALQHDNVFMNMLQDKTFIDRMSHSSMSEDDLQFYRQLESFVQEAQTDVQTEESGVASSSRSHEAQMNDSTAASVGWLSTGPPSTRIMGDIETDPRTPVASTSGRYFNGASTLPLREMGRSLVSPTSRLGNYTTGLLTSLWDRTGGNVVQSSTGPEVLSSQPPSTGDHGHSAEGHIDAEDEDVDMAAEEEMKIIPVQASNADEEWDHQLVIEPRGELATESISSNTRSTGSHRNGSTSSKAISISSNKRKPRFTPFARPGSEDDNANGETSSAKPMNVGLGRPSTLASKMSSLRSATTSEAGRSLIGSLGFDSNDSSPDTFQVGSLPTPKRSISTGQANFPRASMLGIDSTGRKNKPFSYKTHFKLAYQTESNWLRGGRLLTQHVSSDDASGDGATVTSLSIDDEWIIVGMANAKIHAFDARTGLFVRTLTGHSAGVWCLALISASGNKSTIPSESTTNRPTGKGKMRMNTEMDEDHQEGNTNNNVRSVGAYPYDNDRPLYTPTPDLNLIHHDPRPSASVFSPELRNVELSSGDESVQPSLPMPQPPNSTWNSERTTRSIHQSLHSSRSLTPQPERLFTSSTNLPQPPRSAMEAAAAARASHIFSSPEDVNSTRNHTSRGAGLGSNFGSPCGSVAGYGNESAIVVSSGCDRDVRVWDLSTGECKYVLTGHRSTVRCLRVFEGRPIAISGSRDGTMRVWNVETGQLQHLLPGHQHSVRCLDLAGNLVASASYDCTARIWNVDTGKCIHVLRGHYHQLYAIAFDGVHVATGSLDTTVRIWDAKTGECIAMMQAHSSLVGQLQLTDSTLITGGSDGKVIVYSLKTMKTLYQLLAHDNSVTCLQFDDRFIVTGGNDGKVKLWNFRTGEFVRELCEASDQVWKVSFRDDKCVVLCKRNDKTAMDVISFRPIEETS